ncbi:hypothetical protein FRC02_001111 [Tulasnella sp. 418]|nr:hypothetical protein FRC02_001111 [Tulasnella sp. 418]
MPECELFNVVQKEVGVKVRCGKPERWSSVLFRLQVDPPSPVLSVAISPDCMHVASGFIDGKVSIWSVTYGTLIRTCDIFGEPALTAQALAFSPDGTSLVSGHMDGTIAIMDAKTGVLKLKANTPSPSDYSDPNRTVILEAITQIVFAPNGNHFATLSANHISIAIWNAKNCDLIHKFTDLTALVVDMAFSPDSNMLAAYCLKDAALVLDVIAGKFIDQIALYYYPYSAVAFSPDGKHIAFANSFVPSMTIWDVPTKTFVLQKFPEPPSGLLIFPQYGQNFEYSTLMYSSHGTRLICFSSNGAVNIWNAETGVILESFRNHVYYEFPSFFSVSPDASLIASSKPASTEITVGVAQTAIQNDPGKAVLPEVKSLAFSPDGTVIASVLSNDTITLWDADTATCNKTLVSMGVYYGDYSKPIFSPDGTKLAVAFSEWNRGFNVVIWDVLNGVEGIQFGHDEYDAPSCGKLDTITFSSDGDQLALSSELGGIQIWDTISGKCIRSYFAQTDARVRSLVFSPGGTVIFSGCSNNMILARNITTGELSKSLTGHEESVTAMMISLDSRLFSRDKSGKIICWNVDDLEPLEESQVPSVYNDEEYYDLTSTSQKIELYYRNGWVVRISGGGCRPLCSLLEHKVTAWASYGSVFAYGTESGDFRIVDFSKALVP